MPTRRPRSDATAREAVWFGWATEEDLQPNIDGLSFDEVLLIDLLLGILVVLVTWYVTRRGRSHRPMSP